MLQAVDSARSGPYQRLAGWHSELTAFRRDLHAHPELGFEERRTAGRVAEALKLFGVDEVHTGIAKTGVVGVIHGASGPSKAASKSAVNCIGLRADMDALPMREENDFAWRSTSQGLMHGCGHDGHTTMLLGAAKYLAETRDFAGTAYFIFQPAEENEGGGRVMVEEGLFARFPMDQVYGMHNWPGLPVGRFGVREGAMMAANDMFEITVTGHGAHGAMPHQGIDPIVVAAHIVTGLQTIASRLMIRWETLFR